MRSRASLSFATMTLASLIALASPALAQKDGPDAAKAHAEAVAEDVAKNWASAPVEEVTKSGKGTAHVDGKAIPYTQTAGTLTIRDAKGKPVGSMFYTAYILINWHPIFYFIVIKAIFFIIWGAKSNKIPRRINKSI